MRRKLIQSRLSGETLLELVIAITVLTMVLASAFSVLIQASATNENSIKRVGALNIAREGIESVRNIRDTNWLKYSGDRRAKWLCLDTITTPSACEGDNSSLIETGMYRVNFSDAQGRYFLEKTTETLTEKEVLPAEEFRLYQTASGRISHVISDTALPFYRQIELAPEETYLDAACASAGCPKDVRLRVLVRVQWMDGKNIRALDLEAYLYDFFERKAY
jgi:type II secretory pathway pseudopilin PulG